MQPVSAFKRFLFDTAIPLPSSTQTAATVKKHETALADDRVKLEADEKQLGALLVHVDEPGAPASIRNRAERLQQQVTQGLANIAQGEIKLVAARQRHQEAVDFETAQNLAGVVTKVRELQQQREALSPDIEKTAADLVAKLEKMAALGAEIARITPPPVKPEGDVAEIALLGQGRLAAILRVHMASLGWKWMAPTVLWEQGAKTFSQHIAEAGGYLRRILPSAQQ
jgi:hypothetical protein